MESLAPTPDDERLAMMLHALGNPMRLAITRYVADHPGCICNDLVLRFNRAQATMSQHLATLRRANVLVAEQDGPATCYRIDLEQVAWLRQRLSGIADSTGTTGTIV
jgi:ArsR family transcriptional regulator, arsenate/arsenite/antimonite-responsive transcriptional repressor